MANPAPHSSPRPRRARPSRRFDQEITAQPRLLADEVATLSTDEDTLSLFPEDLGSHFLSEAIVQSDLTAHAASDRERALLEDAEIDDGPASAREIALWARIVDRARQGGERLEQLQDAAALGADALEAARERESARAIAADLSVTLTGSSIHEASLLDREGAESDETLTPTVDADDTGRHAQLPASEALGGVPRRPRRGGSKLRGLTRRLSGKH